jgi:hypothetical protein
MSGKMKMFTSRVFNKKKYSYSGNKSNFTLAQKEAKDLKTKGYRVRFTYSQDGINIWRWK